jgi:glycosyltransferase involved in cell wall biosynthesis
MTSFTIAIPTYNRNEKLLSNLNKLLPYVKNEKIIIIDNASDYPVEDTLKETLQQYDNIDVKVYRNKTNIGICANFLRCFEYCETDWLWLLSDDDPPYPNAIEIIGRDIESYPEYTFFNYASSMVQKGVPFALAERSQTFHTKGLKDFVLKLDSFVNVIFVSSGVYNLKKVLPNLRIGYMYSYSLVPHLATVLYSIGNNEKALFSVDVLVDFDPPKAQDTWSRLTFVQVVNLLLEVPLQLDDETFQVLFEKVNKWHLKDHEILDKVSETYSYSNFKKRFVFVQIMARTVLMKRSFKQKLKVLYYLAKLSIAKPKRVNVESVSADLTLKRL